MTNQQPGSSELFRPDPTATSPTVNATPLPLGACHFSPVLKRKHHTRGMNMDEPTTQESLLSSTVSPKNHKSSESAVNCDFHMTVSLEDALPMSYWLNRTS